MVVKRQCSFCAREIEPGTGTMFVKRDGTVFHFCSSSCRKQQLNLGRVGHRFKWTRAHELKRAADRSTAQKAPAAPSGPRAGRTRPAARRPVAPPPQPARPAEASPAPTSEPAPKEVPTSTEPTAPAPAPSTKARRPRKKVEPAANE
jgi:large subunit ribosomal protein L24e